MPLGVSIDEVWGENNLGSRPPPVKKSKYTEPVKQSLAQGYQRSGMHAIQKEYMQGGGGSPQQTRGNLSQTSFPTPQQQQQHHYETPEHIQDNLPVSKPHPTAQEIPYLREKLTQQSTTVNNCQQQVAYLKAMVQNLKQELYNKQQTEKKTSTSTSCKKNWTDCIYMILQIGLLLLVVIMLIRLSQRMDKLMKAPLGV